MPHQILGLVVDCGCNLAVDMVRATMFGGVTEILLALQYLEHGALCHMFIRAVLVITGCKRRVFL